MGSSHHEPTDEQKAIIDNVERARVGIVAAAPGSGKTWLMGQIARREFESWEGPGGMAALSFTRVARDAIGDALGGHVPGHPHFVGTLDSFAYRYVVRAFGPSTDPWYGRLRLVPAAKAKHVGPAWFRERELVVKIGNQRVSIMDVHLVRREGTKALLSYTPRYGSPTLVPDDALDLVRKKKWRLWRELGIASHTDMAYLAWRVATQEQRAEVVRRLLVQRFPVLLVDEVQDTGWFLGSLIRSLFNAGARGLAVGDFDQAIYEFAGARPEDLRLYSEIDGAHEYPMRVSFRCPRSVCTVASRLSWRGHQVVAAPGAAAGHCVMYVYDCESPDIDSICATVESEFGVDSATVLSRSSLEKAVKAPDFRCRALSLMWAAVLNLRRGRPKDALAASSSALSQVMLGNELAQEEDLRSHDIDQEAWRDLTIQTLVRCTSVDEENAFEWGLAVGLVIRAALEPRLPASTDAFSRRLKKPSGATRSRSAYPMEDKHSSARSSRTVHGAKGETLDAPVIYFPRPRRAHRCPATTWFSGDPADAEEMRVGFVAMTRSRQVLTLLVHRETFDRFESDFRAHFDVRMVD